MAYYHIASFKYLGFHHSGFAVTHVVHKRQFLIDMSYPLEYFNEKLLWLHADIKSANILIDYKDSIPYFYMADLSCSMTIQEFQESNMIAGTLAWVCSISTCFTEADIFKIR